MALAAGKKHSFHVMCHISLTEKHPAKEEGMDLTKIVHDARQEERKGLGLSQRFRKAEEAVSVGL
jgi:hypothetical protein